MWLGLLNTNGGILTRDLTPDARSCHFRTNRHGVASIEAEVTNQDLREAFRLYDAPGTPRLSLIEHGIRLGEARVEDRAILNGPVRLQALGYQNALRDTPYVALWSDTRIDVWRALTTDDGAAFVSERYEARITNSMIEVAARKGEGYSSAIIGEISYLVPHGGTREIAAVQFDWEFLAPSSTWEFRAIRRDGSFGLTASDINIAAGVGVATGSVCYTLPATCPIYGFALYYNGALANYTGETGNCYIKITNVRVASATTNFINTTLTAGRAAGASVTATVASTARMYVGQRLTITNALGTNAESVIVESITSATQFVATFTKSFNNGDIVRAIVIYADEIAKDLISAAATLNPSQITSASALIASPALDLTDEFYEDEYAADILDRLIVLGDNQNRRWRWAIEPGQVLRFDAETVGTHTWYVDAVSLELEGSITDLANSVYALYQEPGGRTLRTAVNADSKSVTRYGITRRKAVSASNTTSSATAGTIRDTALADGKNPQPRIGIAFDAVYDRAGARYPLWMIRGGDTIVIRNLSPLYSASVDRIRSFVVDTTDYDAIANTIQVTPASPLPHLDVLLARREERL